MHLHKGDGIRGQGSHSCIVVQQGLSQAAWSIRTSLPCAAVGNSLP